MATQKDKKERGNLSAGRTAPAEKSAAAAREEKILDFWRENNTFEKSLEKPAPKGEFVFYDGPPFATGLPHYGSLLSSIVKDVIPRYKTMRGYHVRRRWGWDCHGLPIENMIEKELGLKTKKDIEKLGIAKFNEACRASVLRYADKWEEYVDRIGRWVEYDNAYKTMDASYMESVWWALKRMHDKKLLYEGRKVLLYCPHCETPLAKAEVQMDNSYRDVTEEAVTVKFKIKPGQKIRGKDVGNNMYLLAWTTTPWTLPGNVALAVGNEIEYVMLPPIKNENYIVSRRSVIRGDFKDSNNRINISTKYFLGKDLVGLEYEPLYEIDAVKKTGKKAWYVTDGDFVNTEEGTGIVHTAVIYGEDDYELGKKRDLPMVPLLDASGKFNKSAPKLIQSKYFKNAEDAIKEDLEKRELLFAKEMHTHSYPHCHRCSTPLLYNAITSWFINIQKVKKRLIRLNERVNWFPAHLKHGRFLNILKDAPDWTISRNRYWASPLPIWRCQTCDKLKVIGSIDELKKHTKTSGNRYFVMRHGESPNNVHNVVMNDPENSPGLTERGRRQVRESLRRMRKGDFDIIFTSPFPRARETALLIQDGLALNKGQLCVEDRIKEFDLGDFDGKPIEEYYKFIGDGVGKMTKQMPNGESMTDVRRRTGEFLYELEKKHKGKSILIVSHDDALWGLTGASVGADNEKMLAIDALDGEFIKNAEIRELQFTPLSHNPDYELDLHRPYIDELVLACDCGEEMKRISEVVDGWVESGAMPFAEYHYPLENKRVFKKRSPGDFVAEYIAQTRTWFYYMHAIAGILFRKPSFKNVLSTGTILAGDGSKMSKSKGNYTNPFLNLDRFGADALRYYLMTSVVMRAEDLRFSDEELREAHNRVVNILWNVFRFYDMYADSEHASLNVSRSPNVLDVWIRARLAELAEAVTEGLESFDTVRAGRPIRDFIDDFSTWYIRRSRERFKVSGSASAEAVADRQMVLATTRFVLLELSKLMAPFTPFIAEDIYLRVGGERESVHLEDWPDGGKADEGVLKKMAEVRRVVSLALEARQTARIKVRQPLAKLILRKTKNDITNEHYLALLRDELNVKEVVFDDSTGWEIELDTNITPELKREGQFRELVRQLQDLRKASGLSPNDAIALTLDTNSEGRGLVETFQDELKSAVFAQSVSFEAVSDGTKIMIDDINFSILLVSL